MRQLNYESKLPVARRADLPDGPQLGWWLASCFASALAGAGTAIIGAALFHPNFGTLYFGGFVIVIWIAGVIGAGLALPAVAPLLVFVQRQRTRLLLTAIVSFSLTAGLLTLFMLATL